jgi:hypothetical protein
VRRAEADLPKNRTGSRTTSGRLISEGINKKQKTKKKTKKKKRKKKIKKKNQDPA